MSEQKLNKNDIIKLNDFVDSLACWLPKRIVREEKSDCVKFHVTQNNKTTTLTVSKVAA